MSRILNPFAALPISTAIILNLYLIIVGISVLAELDKSFTRYVLHCPALTSLANFYNKYVIYISYFHTNTGLGSA
jgi:hypothetical protein